MNPAPPSFKTPSVMRYDRVQAILENDPLLKESLGPKDQEIVKRNKEKHYYSRGVVAVTNALHEHGLDAHNADRSMVLRTAADVLKVLGDAPAKAPKAEKPKAIVAKPAQVPAPAKPKPEPKPKPDQKPKVVAKPKELPKPKESVSAPAPKPAPIPSQSPISNEAVPVYYVYQTGISLVLGLRRIMEMDQHPGFEARQQKIDDLYNDLYKLRNVAVPIPIDMMPPSQNATVAEHSKS